MKRKRAPNLSLLVLATHKSGRAGQTQLEAHVGVTFGVACLTLVGQSVC